MDVDKRPDGSWVLRSALELEDGVERSFDWLGHWARHRPETTFLAERDKSGGWRTLSYAQALDAARRIGSALNARNFGPERPLVILSENSVDHGLLALGASIVGVPIVPISTAYSLQSSDHGKLRQIVTEVSPGGVFASDTARYGPALQSIGHDSVVIDDLLNAAWDERAQSAMDRVGPDSLVKILYTSGSTGAPKGVLTTQRMITRNQQQAAQVWQFLNDQPPTVVDWLPWSHTFGGNFTFNCVLAHGGTLFVDAGKPAPGLFEQTVANLREISPSIYFNVPRGFELLVPRLEQDAALRESFFRQCTCIFYAAAALPAHLWTKLHRLALDERGGDLALISAWGSTETGPMATAVHGGVDAASGCIGLPVPGCELKLVTNAGKLEARLRGPNITPGYWRQPALTTQAFDEEGFYRIGDALRFVDPAQPQLGLLFDGRTAEDFKLSSGTWVHVGALRLRLIEAGQGLIQDAVLTGHDRAEVGALLYLNPARSQGIAQADLAAALRTAISSLSADSQTGSSLRITRAIVLDVPPSLDRGEINDKGYINQRAVLNNRATLVEALYDDAGSLEVMRLT